MEDADPIPKHIRDLLARWSLSSIWLRVRHVRTNVANAVAIAFEEAPSADPCDHDYVRRAAKELNSYGNEHEELKQFLTTHHPALLDSFPAIPLTNVLTNAEAGRCAERMLATFGRVLEAVKRAGNPPEKNWSRPLSVASCRRILGASKKKISTELNRMKAAGHARDESRQDWRLDLAALGTDQRERYEAIVAEEEKAVAENC